MIRGMVGRWKAGLAWWRAPRILKAQADAEYESLAREFGLLTARCLSAQEDLERERGTAARLADRLGQLQAQYAVDVPGLTPGETERLAILSEECGEVVAAVGKILRYGWERQSPYGGKPNRNALEQELGNVRAVVNLMLDSGDLRLAAIQSWQRNKRTALEKWTLYQECSMPRDKQLAMMQSIRESAAGNN